MIIKIHFNKKDHMMEQALFFLSFTPRPSDMDFLTLLDTEFDSTTGLNTPVLGDTNCSWFKRFGSSMFGWYWENALATFL